MHSASWPASCRVTLSFTIVVVFVSVACSDVALKRQHSASMMPQRAGCDRRKTENNGDASLAHSDDLCRRQRGLRARPAAYRAGIPVVLAMNLSVASAQACLSATASGMMALTGIVFAMAFVMVQFNAIAYSPRLVLWFARDQALFHSLGAFSATFIYALFSLAWIDRGQSGAVPLFSTLLVAVMLIVSMLLFARLVQRLSDLQITSVLQLIGDKGREVIRDTFQRLDERPKIETKPVEPRDRVALRPTIQIIAYSGSPRTIAKVNVDARVQQAERSGASSRWSPLWAIPLSMAALSCGFTETRSGLPKRM